VVQHEHALAVVPEVRHMALSLRFYNAHTGIDHPDASVTAGPYGWVEWSYDQLYDDLGNAIAYTRHQGQHLGCWNYQNVWYTNVRIDPV